MVTLTWDTEKWSIWRSWKDVGYWFNRWISRLRRVFKSIFYMRVWESSEKGYPHVHLLMYFPTVSFAVYRHRSRDGKRVTWRLRSSAVRRLFDLGWHSFVDVLAVQLPDSAYRYIRKYISKGYFSEKGVITLALCWLFRKKSFSISRGFIDLIVTNGCSNGSGAVAVVKQGVLDGSEARAVYVWRFLGANDRDWETTNIKQA